MDDITIKLNFNKLNLDLFSVAIMDGMDKGKLIICRQP